VRWHVASMKTSWIGLDGKEVEDGGKGIVKSLFPEEGCLADKLRGSTT
jgi:hypothetical protein